jgi:Ca-activated chloride channel family protein
MIFRHCRLTLWLFVVLPAGASAQGLLLPRPVPGIPRLPALSVKHHRIQVTVDAGTARTEVSQVFVNPTDRVLEGTYIFPLPEDAAVSQFRMTIDKEPVEGKILDRDEARRIYEDYVRRTIDPALLEYAGRGAFQARVFPIPAHGEKEIQLAYSQVVPFTAGVYQYRYPIAKNIDGSVAEQVVVNATIHSPQPIKAVYSPSYSVAVSRPDEHTARVSAESDSSGDASDFLLYYTVSQKEFGLNLLAHRRGQKDGYFLMMLAPQRAVPREKVAPKDILFVFDTSGSMSGRKIEQAKQALRFSIEHLNPRDRFNIIRFSSEVEPFRKNIVDATPAEVHAAESFVDGLEAAGGTNINDALETAFESMPRVRLASTEERPTMIVFMTDGEPTVGETSLERIIANVDQENRHRARIFIFGVGDDVNTLLLDRLARDGDGVAEYVRPNEDLELKVSAFVSKIANPVLSDVKLEVSGAEVTDLAPRRLPDLFAGSQFLVFGRYHGAGRATVRLAGQIGGQERVFTYPVEFPDTERGNDFIPRLWASRKIGTLLEEIRLHGENPELKDEVIRLSKQFGVPTPYTSLLVEEPRELQQRGGINAPADRGSLASSAPGGIGGSGGGVGGFGGIPGGSQPALAPLRQYGFGGRDSASAGGFQQQTGASAVAASKAVKDLKTAEVEATGGGVRRVGGKTFLFHGGSWTDTEVDGKGTTLAVKFGSEAYFQIARQYPELAQFLALGQEVALRVKPGLTLQVGAAGKEKLTPAEVASLKH